MTTTNRPTCGTCPHRVQTPWTAECHAHPPQGTAYLVEHSDFAQPVRWKMSAVRPSVDETSSGCIYHPQMAAYIANVAPKETTWHAEH